MITEKHRETKDNQKGFWFETGSGGYIEFEAKKPTALCFEGYQYSVADIIAAFQEIRLCIEGSEDGIGRSQDAEKTLKALASLGI